MRETPVRILVIEDEVKVARALKEGLEGERAAEGELDAAARGDERLTA